MEKTEINMPIPVCMRNYKEFIEDEWDNAIKYDLLYIFKNERRY